MLHLSICFSWGHIARYTILHESPLLCFLAGRVFGLLQLVLAVTDLLSNVFFTSIYPPTLGWFSGFCFLLSCVISYISAVPIMYVNLSVKRQQQKLFWWFLLRSCRVTVVHFVFQLSKWQRLKTWIHLRCWTLTWKCICSYFDSVQQEPLMWLKKIG